MLLQVTIEKLYEMRLVGMAKALEHQLTLQDCHDLSFEDRLGLIVDQELTYRENRKLAVRLKGANLKKACIENINYKKQRGLEKSTVKQLATCDWVRQKRNVLVHGPTGIGKTYVCCALAHQSCQHGFTALYERVPRLVHSLMVARADGSYRKLLAKLAKIDVLILDDFGIQTLVDDSARDLLEVIDDRSGLRSSIIASQLPFNDWHQTIVNPTLSDAILDRVMHNSYKLKMKGPSMRKEEEGEQMSDEPTH